MSISRTNPVLALSLCAAALTAMAALSGCHIAPKYVRPQFQAPPAYKDETTQPSATSPAWSAANPADASARGAWWLVFNDAQLSDLEKQVDVSNQNIALAAANYAAARALVRETRSQYFPTASLGAGVQTARLSVFPAVNLTSGASYTEYTLPLEASWEPDIWGRVRNSVHSAAYAAQSDAATLESVRLAMRAQVAMNYFQIRAQDALADVLDSTISSDQSTLDITQSLAQSGLSNDEAVAAAEAQLQATKAQRENIRITRAQYEHALALLLGKTPADFSLPVMPLQSPAPDIPPGVPATLLERRPDIAAAERTVAQANAQIGIARSAYFPNLTLSGSVGYESLSALTWVSWPSRVWAVGPSIAETIFDAGLRRATVQEYRARYDASVATYRQTVLTAFQQVEDNLAATSRLRDEIRQQNLAVEAANRQLAEATTRYKSGLDPYLNVIQAEQTVLSYRQTEVSLRSQQMNATVQLIQALGGGWSVAQLPSTDVVRRVSTK